MKSDWVLYAVGGVAVAGLVWANHRATAAALERARGVPPGYRRLQNSELTAELVARAPGYLDRELGDVVPFVAADGRRYLAVLETHQDPPEGLRPYPHKGVSLFVMA